MYRAGDRERAFGELVKSFSERLYWHVRGLVGSHEDTDDLLQDIFVKIWNGLATFRGDSQLFTWVFRIATNEALNFLRKQSLRATFGLEEAERVVDNDSYFGGNEMQHFAFDIFFAANKEFLANMRSNNFNIAHQTFHIFKDIMVDALETIGSLSYSLGRYNIRIIDKTDPQRLRLRYFIPNCKML